MVVVRLQLTERYPAEIGPMSTAYFIVLDNKNPGFDTFVNGKAVMRETDAISRIGRSLGLRDIHDFASFASIADEFDVDPELPDAEEKWFRAAEGVAWVQAIRTYLDSHPTAVENIVAVQADLAEYQRVLEAAARIDANWHFEIDL